MSEFWIAFLMGTWSGFWAGMMIADLVTATSTRASHWILFFIFMAAPWLFY